MTITINDAISLKEDVSGALKKIGLLNEKLLFSTKCKLQRLLRKIEPDLSAYQEDEKNLFLSLGAVEENGLLLVKAKLEDGNPNPALVELDRERTIMRSQTIDIGDHNFSIDEFNFDCESNYETFIRIFMIGD